MTIYRFEDNTFTSVQTTFADEGILERSSLQSALKENIETVAEDCMVIAEEFSEWSGSQRRIDLLAVDKNANIVVIEIKRTEKGERMELQAIRYAAMVSTLTFKRATTIYQKYLKDNEKDPGKAEDSLMQFFGWEDESEQESFASDVRIILISSNFSKEITTSVMWLNEHKNFDITCVRLVPYKLEGKIFVDAQQIIPLPEATDYQVRVREQSIERKQARKSPKDFTQYEFNGKEYNKRRLVLAVIQKWVQDNNPQSFEDLDRAFPESICSGGVFKIAIEAKEIYKRQGRERHFLRDDEILEIGSEKYAISNQWGKRNIVDFFKQTEELGFEIKPVASSDESDEGED